VPAVVGDLINCFRKPFTFYRTGRLLVDWLIDFPELHAVCRLRFLLVFSFRHSTLDSHLQSTVQYSTIKYNCTVLNCTVLYCELYSTVLWTVQYCIVLYFIVLYSIVQHCTVLYSSSTIVSTKHNLSISQSSKEVEYNGFMLVKQPLSSTTYLRFEHVRISFVYIFNFCHFRL